jgi:RecA-family ATPase
MTTNNNPVAPITGTKPRVISVAEQIIADGDRFYKMVTKTSEHKGIFTIRTASRWIEEAQLRPIPRMLFGEFWFEGELCILFADTNLGKSILAVQIGNSISKGEEIPGFRLETGKQPILYFDFELSDKQFENRYSVNYQQHYTFDDNFMREEINPEAEIPDGVSFEDFLSHSLERSIAETGARILIIDNLTYLKNETEKAKDALPLMKQLKALKSKYGLSILALAHTPKRDLTKPITRNDLQGSKMLMNFCDSSFAIGESNADTSLRYLKQIKQRSTEQIYDADNVCVCQVVKPENFLQFQLIGHSSEWKHLKKMEEQEVDDRLTEATQMRKNGASNHEIARKYGVSEGAVRKWFRKSEPVNQ